MKTAAKIATLALAAALIAVLAACLPEAELTSPDWGTVQSEYNPGYGVGNVVDQSLMRPVVATVSGNSLPNPSSTPSSASAAYVKITFPKGADVLQASNGTQIETRLKSFLKFYDYTTPTGASTFDPDILGNEYTYSFVRRTAGVNGGAAIEIKFDSFNTLPTGRRLVAKIDETRYTFYGGLKLNMDDPDFLPTDLYTSIAVSGSSQANFVAAVDRRWSLAIANITGGGSYTTTPAQQNNITVATLTINAPRTLGGDPSPTPGHLNTARLDILDSVKNKIRVEKYEPATRRWTDFPVSFTTVNSGLIRFTYNPTDVTAYRVKATGVRNLTTDAEYGGVRQKIFVTGTIYTTDYSTQSYKGYSRNEVVGQPVFWYQSGSGGREVQSSFAVASNGLRVQSDINGKNVVLWLKTAGISSSYFQQTSYNIAYFNRHFKIGCLRNPNGTTSALNATSMFDSAAEFIPIRAVEVVSSDTSANTITNDELKITLDPNYTYDSTAQKSLLISPDIKLFTNNRIEFGNYASNWYREINGIPYFLLATATLPTNF